MAEAIRPIETSHPSGATPLFLLQLADGEPADPAVFVGGVGRDEDDRFATSDGSQWRILRVGAATAQLAARGVRGDLDRRAARLSTINVGVSPVYAPGALVGLL
jgi:hypothetical protein